MNKKIVTLLKMLVLSVGMIIAFRFIANNFTEDETNTKIEYGSGDTQYGFSMGTSISATLYGDDLVDAFSEVMEEIDRLDTEYISWRNEESELGKLNANYVLGEEYLLSKTLYDAIFLSWQICEDSNGALDITIRPVADVWNIEESDSESFEIPELADIEDSLSLVGYEYISLDDSKCVEKEVAGGEITIAKDNMIIDLGATGKGYALDIIRNCLDTISVKGACISVGGSILVYGKKDDGSSWRVGIRDPQGASDEMIGYLEFPAGTNICVSTSGYYEKYFMVDGVRYHHILDRSTGKPADSGLASVTVVCENGLYSDALSTACFVLGYEQSFELLEKYDAEAIFIDEDNNIILTEGLIDIFTEK